MSIYAVKLMEWFPRPKKNQHDVIHGLYDTARMMVKLSRCLACGKKPKWNRAIGHHSIPWGTGDIWCSEPCLNSNKVSKKQDKKKPRGKRNKMLRNYVIKL